MSKLNTRSFGVASGTATADAVAGREELGRNCAGEFLKNPGSFDPRKLTLLGRPGLLSFIATVGVPVSGNVQAKEPEAEKSASGDSPSGWAPQRHVPFSFEFVGFALGTLIGGGIIFGSALWFGL